MGKTEENGASSISLRLTENETKICYLTKDIEDLSDMITRQGRLLEQLAKQVNFLTQKETERNDLAGIVLGDKPPHW
jgi:uncharacterized coiled-coil protein SlyX